MLTMGADIQVSCFEPVGGIAASFTNKTMGPPLFESLFVTGFGVRETGIESDLAFRKIFSDRGICHGMASFL